MFLERDNKTSALLYGMDQPMASELGKALNHDMLKVHAQFCEDLSRLLIFLRKDTTDVVFCAAEESDDLLAAVRQHRPGLPVIVVSRHPAEKEWLDAMDAGASDYCSAPFEPTHLRWILESSLRPALKAAV